MTEHVDDHIETVRVRRAPKFAVFLLVGAALGFVVAMILTFAFDGSSETSPNTGLVYSEGQVFGFLVLICVPVFLAIAAVIALVFDRRSRSRTREVTVDHASVEIDDQAVDS
jgi:H+/Cl- antiporter ClcA